MPGITLVLFVWKYCRIQSPSAAVDTHSAMHAWRIFSKLKREAWKKGWSTHSSTYHLFPPSFILMIHWVEDAQVVGAISWRKMSKKAKRSQMKSNQLHLSNSLLLKRPSNSQCNFHFSQVGSEQMRLWDHFPIEFIWLPYRVLREVRPKQIQEGIWAHQVRIPTKSKRKGIDISNQRDSGVNRSTFECPVCKQKNFERASLLSHVRKSHPKATAVCPICVVQSYGDPNYTTHLAGHLEKRHKFDLDTVIVKNKEKSWLIFGSFERKELRQGRGRNAGASNQGVSKPITSEESISP